MYTKTVLALLALLLFAGCDSNTSTPKYDTLPLEIEQKEALSYMWHEERLAHDLYLALYAFHDNNMSIKPLSMIATNSEVTHVSLVEALVEKYDINVTNLSDYTLSYSADELAALPAGTYAIPAIQNLYDTLLAEGQGSEIAALEAGCKVEVVDVNDLDAYITLSQDYPDLVTTFEALRTDSYTHYWKFNDTIATLKGGDLATDGCCAVALEYCKTEAQYPR